MFSIHTTTDIDAPPERVWAVLEDVAGWHRWNPLITAVEGQLAEGARLRIRLALPALPFRLPVDVRVLALQPPHELRWRGPANSRLGRGLSGEHYFMVEGRDGGGATFLHGERFTGLAVGLFERLAGRELKRRYAAVNAALKAHVEHH